jgi:chaperone BCS1
MQFSSESEEVTIAVLGFSVTPIKALLQQIISKETAEAKTITVYQPVVSPNNLVGWRPFKRPGREINSIFQSLKLRKEILTDIYCFLHQRSRKMHERRGIPYRRGYLFSGPPGTGKSSMITALATAFKLPIYRISLGQTNDVVFTALIRAVLIWAIVVIEDIDCAGLENRSEKASNSNYKQSVSLSTLLNAMDGMEAGTGRILIATANFPETLDPAITREGRIHMIVPFDFITSEQAQQMFENFYSKAKDEDNDTQDEGVDNVYKSFGFNPSDAWASRSRQEWIGDLKVLSIQFSELVPKGWQHAKVEKLLIRNQNDPTMAIKQLHQEVVAEAESKIKLLRQKEAELESDIKQFRPEGSESEIEQPCGDQDGSAKQILEEGQEM